MDSREFSEWIAYDEYVDPLPDTWLQTGILASLVANALGSKRRMAPADFIPRHKPPQSPQQVINVLHMAVEAARMAKSNGSRR